MIGSGVLVAGGRMVGMPSQQWVCQFRDCPDTEDVEVLAEQESRPRQVLVRRRPGAADLVDGYVLQALDVRERTAVYTWVQAGEPDPVAAYLLELLPELCPTERAR